MKKRQDGTGTAIERFFILHRATAPPPVGVSASPRPPWDRAPPAKSRTGSSPRPVVRVPVVRRFAEAGQLLRILLQRQRRHGRQGVGPTLPRGPVERPDYQRALLRGHVHL